MADGVVHCVDVRRTIVWVRYPPNMEASDDLPHRPSPGGGGAAEGVGPVDPAEQLITSGGIDQDGAVDLWVDSVQQGVDRRRARRRVTSKECDQRCRHPIESGTQGRYGPTPGRVLAGPDDLDADVRVRAHDHDRGTRGGRPGDDVGQQGASVPAQGQLVGTEPTTRSAGKHDRGHVVHTRSLAADARVRLSRDVVGRRLRA